MTQFEETNPEEAGFDPGRLSRISDALNADVDAQKIPGAVVLLARNGKLAWWRAFGLPALLSDAFGSRPIAKRSDSEPRNDSPDDIGPPSCRNHLGQLHTHPLRSGGSYARHGTKLWFGIRSPNSFGRQPTPGLYWRLLLGRSFGTYFWIDPAEKLIAIFMSQAPELRTSLPIPSCANWFYQAIELSGQVLNRCAV